MYTLLPDLRIYTLERDINFALEIDSRSSEAYFFMFKKVILTCVYVLNAVGTFHRRNYRFALLVNTVTFRGYNYKVFTS